jgi:hypothetical protein
MRRFILFIFAVCLICAISLKAWAQHEHHDQGTKNKDSKNQPTDSASPSKSEPIKTETHEHHQDQQEHKSDHSMPDHQTKPGHDSTSHDAAAVHEDHEDMSMTGGPYRSHLAIGSGTSILPASSPAYMWHFSPGNWKVMLHGELKSGFNYQSGPRGVGKAESQNYLMLMAQRKLVGGEIIFRGMFSAEPLTVPHGGFPQLFQVGETYRGRPIVDAQHAHDLFMELALSYTYPISDRVSFQIYGGPVAEPALGPVAFMHRPSAIENPTAPLGHHWQDSTHISHGVFTAAITAWRFKLEGSIFNGREPDENRATIDLDTLDSYSGRLWFTPTRNWSMQVSHGRLKEPEAQEPGDISRTTASISYNRELQDGNWATTLIWGRNSTNHGDSNTYLFESTVNFLRKNYFYTRIELADRERLLEENIFGRPGLISNQLHLADEDIEERDSHFEPQFRISAFTFGGVRDVISTSKLLVGIGADLTFYHKPDELDPIYGRNPVGIHFFIRVRPARMNH